MHPHELDYSTSTPEGLDRFQVEVAEAADDLVLMLMDFGRDHDLPPAVVTSAASCALATLLADLYMDGTHGQLDEQLEEEATDFRLTLFKHFALHHPSRVSAEFRLMTARLDRTTKRRRQMVNAPEGGEA